MAIAIVLKKRKKKEKGFWSFRNMWEKGCLVFPPKFSHLSQVILKSIL